jgi:hypothetical protein
MAAGRLQTMMNQHWRWSCVLLGVIAGAASGGCTPTVRVEVAPISIYAKLDADVRVRLDREVQSAIQHNPDLFPQ